MKRSTGPCVPRLARVSQAALIAVSLYAAFLSFSAPATLAGWLIADATKGTVLLERPEGSLWRGRASALAIVGGKEGLQRYANFSWNLGNDLLLRGKIAARVNIADPRLRGNGEVSLEKGRVRVHSASIEIPASELARHVPGLSRWKPVGVLTLRTQDFAYANGVAWGKATLLWSETVSKMGTARVLGEYGLQIGAARNGTEFRVSSDRAALKINGRGTWTSNQGFRFDGSATLDPQHRTGLSGLLGTADLGIR
jgi:hypothetical protein